MNLINIMDWFVPVITGKYIYIYIYFYLYVQRGLLEWGQPQHAQFIVANPSKMNDLGVPVPQFKKTFNQMTPNVCKAMS